MSKFQILSCIGLLLCLGIVSCEKAISEDQNFFRISIGCGIGDSYPYSAESNNLKVEAKCNDDGVIEKLIFSGKIPSGQIEWGNPEGEGEPFVIPLNRELKAKPGMLHGVTLTIPN